MHESRCLLRFQDSIRIYIRGGGRKVLLDEVHWRPRFCIYQQIQSTAVHVLEHSADIVHVASTLEELTRSKPNTREFVSTANRFRHARVKPRWVLAREIPPVDVFRSLQQCGVVDWQLALRHLPTSHLRQLQDASSSYMLGYRRRGDASLHEVVVWNGESVVLEHPSKPSEESYLQYNYKRSINGR